MTRVPSALEVDAAGLQLFVIEGNWKRSIVSFDAPLSAITVRHEAPSEDSEPGSSFLDLEIRRSPAVGVDLLNTALLKLVAVAARVPTEVAPLLREAERLRWSPVVLPVAGQQCQFRRAALQGFWCAVAAQPVAGTMLTLVGSANCRAEALSVELFKESARARRHPSSDRERS